MELTSALLQTKPHRHAFSGGAEEVSYGAACGMLMKQESVLTLIYTSLAKSALAASVRSSAAPSACAPCLSSAAMRLASALSPSALMPPRIAWSKPVASAATLLLHLAVLHVSFLVGGPLPSFPSHLDARAFSLQ